MMRQEHSYPGEFEQYPGGAAFNGEPSQARRIIQTYDYEDGDGELLFQVVRYEPKAFRQRRPDGNGGWIWNLNDVELVPYRLPSFPNDGGTLYLVEGEKDAEALRSLGFAATCNPGGASKWPANLAQYFEDLSVIIIPDNDDAGHKHADRIARSLCQVASSVRILELPDLPPKGDVSDWLAAGGTPRELFQLAAATPKYEPPPDQHDHAKQPFTLTRFGDVRLGTDRPYLVKGLLPRGGLIVAWGPPKCGKSLWVSDIALHIALGWEYRGRRVDGGAVVYIAAEGQAGLPARTEAFRKKKLSDPSANPPFFLLPTRLDLVHDIDVLIAAIQAQLGGMRCVLIVLDTLNRTLAGSESKDEDMGAYVQACDRLREAFQCAVLVVHHCGIDDKRPRGHTSLTGAADAQIAVKRDDNGNIIATVEYMKDGTEGDQIVSRLETVDVGIDEDGDPITSCIIAPVDDNGDRHITKKSPKRSPNHQRALDLLKDEIARGGTVPPSDNHIPANTLCIREGVWREACYLGSISGSDEPDAKRMAFKRAAEALVVDGAIGKWGEFVWLA